MKIFYYSLNFDDAFACIFVQPHILQINTSYIWELIDANPLSFPSSNVIER